jgi:hypothetical protein
MLPNFLIIGGQRCATGWIAQCLREHPEVFMAQDETRFFDWNFAKGTDWWEQNYFSAAHDEQAIGEKTANYLTDIDVPGRIFNTLPHAKIICCLRNPVDRLYSAFMMKARNNQALKEFSVDEVVREEPDLVERGRYSTYLRQYYRLFSDKQILVLLYDDKQKDPHCFVKTIYDFLGVDPDVVPRSLLVQTKPGALENSSKYLARISQALLHRHSPFRRLYSALRPSRKSSQWSCAEFQHLSQIYEEEINALETLIGRKLPEWRS